MNLESCAVIIYFGIRFYFVPHHLHVHMYKLVCVDVWYAQILKSYMLDMWGLMACDFGLDRLIQVNY